MWVTMARNISFFIYLFFEGHVFFCLLSSRTTNYHCFDSHFLNYSLRYHKFSQKLQWRFNLYISIINKLWENSNHSFIAIIQNISASISLRLPPQGLLQNKSLLAIPVLVLRCSQKLHMPTFTFKEHFIEKNRPALCYHHFLIQKYTL